MSSKKNVKRKKHTKKQKMYALAGLVFVVVALIIFLSIAIPYFKDRKNSGYNSRYKYDGVSLVGKWQEKDNFSDEAYKIYEFFDNGKVVTTMFVYGIEKVSDTSSTYRIDDENTLVISYSVGNVVQSSQNEFSISKDKSTLVLKDGNNFTILERYDLEYNKDTGIFGEWVNTQNENDTYNFKNDFTGVMADAEGTNKIVYSTNGDNLYFFIDEYMAIKDYALTADFVIGAKYKIENNVLSITIGEKTNNYIRK